MNPLPDLRAAIAGQVLRLVSSGGPPGPPRGPDPGLFGPASAAWKVHSDFTSMMVGGVTALLMQMLHPGALAGVWDHSNFRNDMAGRLRGTARFIEGTTYGVTDEALALIARVKAIHDKVSGRLPDGTPYSANDPHLLTWVHVAEVSSFLAAYLRYRDPGFPGADQDRYYAETAEIAVRLGATEVPRSRAEAAAYFDAVRPELVYDDRTREVARVLLSQPAPSRAAAPAARLMFQAAQDLLPPWAQAMHGFELATVQRPAVRLGVQGLGGVLRWALPNNAEVRARLRVSRSA